MQNVSARLLVIAASLSYAQDAAAAVQVTGALKWALVLTAAELAKMRARR